jgi:hypothetical protein
METKLAKSASGGEGGIRTPDTGFGPYNGLANRRLQPLGHLSGVCRQQFTTYSQVNWHISRILICISCFNLGISALMSGRIWVTGQLSGTHYNFQ